MNADPQELAKFSQLAHSWWNKDGECKPLHDINPLRLDFIESHCSLSHKKVIDIGCGGGILAEGMALRGAHVTGIDLAEKALRTAQLHLYESKLDIQYQHISAEDKALIEPEQYDIVTCLEMLEHVPDPNSIVKACATLCKANGWVFFSTINRQLKAYLQAIIGAEYILHLLPRGIHDYTRFIKPSELIRMLTGAELACMSVKGIGYRLMTKTYELREDPSVNYLLAARKIVE